MSPHKQFDHLRIPLEEIVSATDNFSDANFIRYDGFGKEYKGQLLQSGRLVDIVARRLDDKNGIGIKEFWMEVSMLCTLEHQNIVSIVGFCDDGDDGEKIVINKLETRGSLCNYLTDPCLTWMRRLQICVGVARALYYIHYDEGRDFGVIHRDIKSSKILLDDNWEAKLYGFELSMNQAAAEWNCVSYNKVCGTPGYMDPTYVKTGSVSHKSDMFSFGVVLIEVLCGKVTEAVNEGEDYLYELAKSHIENGRLYDMVNPGLWKQMDPQSFKIFSEIAYCCLKAEPSERPSIDQILIQLEKALESQQEQENHQEKIEGATSKSLKVIDLFWDEAIVVNIISKLSLLSLGKRVSLI
ncbi:unnamed protein product [Lactuca saligna]|uniref:Protein kinase domain-containing protein n=1 Tax=Lactuca saligna TaxID=75948 RepID=A0AA35VK67_LACSI|nr:unnamed protein product [Lactuca saligna]